MKTPSDAFEAKLLSKYQKPPMLPSTANYHQIKVLARSGDGRGPVLPPRNHSQHVGASPHNENKMKRMRNQIKQDS